MSRINKTTNGVFTNIVGNQYEFPTYDTFIKSQDSLNKPSKTLSNFLKEYKNLILKNKPTFERMANLEDVIMQIRILENFNPNDIKFNIVREYIYARIPFHRRDKEVKDVRVIVGLIHNFGSNIDDFYINSEFMDLTIKKIKDSMNNIINQNIISLTKTK